MNTSVVVVGSSNTDMVITTSRIPVPGETILGGQFALHAGGKGANQAVAAARLGGHVSFIARLGNDLFGRQAIDNFKKENINVSHVFTDASHPSGTAMIIVDSHGENCIVVAPGANAHLSVTDIENAAYAIANAAVIVVQLEIPIETVCEIAKLAKQRQLKLLLNPAPACELPAEIYDGLYMITPNKKEAEMLTGITITNIESCRQAAAVFTGRGVQHIIITMGEEGAYVHTAGGGYIVPAQKVKAVDTTAAGDVFNGALAVAIANEEDIKTAVAFACRASAISVTRAGAQASAPYLHEIDVS
ncbi:ribokinase [Foetidibacter luteolus]|uniref:ribokinase n=1 Tax=Foetidibacter luteolus TaxID=2608880 RepID=UPI00129AEF3D|nr:ribokinase [Foetidibacter luteolus]